MVLRISVVVLVARSLVDTRTAGCYMRLVDRMAVALVVDSNSALDKTSVGEDLLVKCKRNRTTTACHSLTQSH